MDETFSRFEPHCSIDFINYNLLPYIISHLPIFETLYERPAYAFKQAQFLFHKYQKRV